MAAKNLNWIIIAVIAVFLFVNFNGLEKQGALTTVVRSVDRPTVYLGDAVTVTLTITPDTGDKAILIEETAPFIIAGDSDNVYQAGLLDGSQVQPDTRTYSFTPDSEGTFPISGVFNPNNEGDQAITGVSSITVTTCTPISQEYCNNLDDDCDYGIDEDLGKNCYTGPAGTAGVGICQEGFHTCTAGVWGSCAGQVHPTTEICNNGVDEDCDGADLVANSKADIDCDNAVSWTEINNAVGDWLGGLYSWLEINTAVGAWLG